MESLNRSRSDKIISGQQKMKNRFNLIWEKWCWLACLLLTVGAFITCSSCSINVTSEPSGHPPPLWEMITDGATAQEIEQEIARDPSIVGKTGTFGQTNLYYAVSEERVDIAKILLEAGEDPNIFYNYSPLASAITSENVELVALLLSHGADPMKPVPMLLNETPYSMRDSCENQKIRKLLEESVKSRADQ